MSDLDEKLYDAVSKNKLAEVIELLGRGASVNYQDNYYECTPLHEAAKQGNVEIADLLIRNKADVNAPDNYGDTPLHEGINSDYNQGNMVMMMESLIRLGANVSVSNNKGVTPLHKAVRNQYVEIAELLIRNKADVNAPDSVGDTPLHEGIKSYYNQGNMVMMLESLIRLGANVSVSNNKGETPLHQAGYRGKVEIADLLIKNSADVNALDKHGATPLHKAAEQGNFDNADLLIRHKADINVPDKDKATPLHRAAGQGRVNVTDLLIRNKADINVADIFGATPLHKAVEQGKVAVADLLIKNKADINTPDTVGVTPLHKAAAAGQLEIIDVLIRNNAEVNVSDNNGKTPLDLPEDKCKTDNWYIANDEGVTPLHKAAEHGQVDGINVLIRNNAEVNATDNNGATPLHQAAERRNVKVVDLLIRNKANIYAPDNVGKTPLDLLEDACQTQHWFIKNDKGSSPLHQAASDRKMSMITALVSLGANVLAVNAEGRKPLFFLERTYNKLNDHIGELEGDSALHKAVILGDTISVIALLTLGADLSAQNKKNQTPLHVVKYKEDAELLIQYGADVNSRDINNQTPLHLATHKDVAQILIQNGADVNSIDFNGQTPLHVVNNQKVIEILIQNRADVNSVDINGDSPLHEAASQGKESVIKMLVSAGVNVSARNKKGTTPYELAEKGYQKNEGHVFSAKKYKKTLNYLEDAFEQQTLPDKKHEEYSKQSNFPKAGPYKQKIEKDIKLPWLVDADEFRRMLSHGEYLSYENRLSLGGPCRAGKSTLASVLIDEEIPLNWNSTDGLVIFFGRNGIDIENKKMVPLKKGERGHEVYAKILRGKPDFCKSPDLETRQQILALEEAGQAFYSDVATPVSTAKYTQRDDASGHCSTVKVAYKTAASSIKPLPGNFEPQVTSSSLSTVTTELESLEFQKLQLQSSILDEVRNGKYKIDIAPSDLIDFGGQKSYDMTHQLFIQHKGSFLLMFDGRYGLHTHLKDYPDGVTAASIIKHWVDSILTYTADTDEIMPMILFAATHRDMCEGDTKKMKESFLADIKEMFSSHEKKNHIHLETLYFINGVDKNDVEIQKMTDQIVIFAMKQTSWGQRRPMQWVPLELQISNMKMKNINILTKENLQQVNELNADLALNENQMDDFLLVQHSLGKLMYYNLPGLDKFIIIHPPALVNILRSFVTDEQFWPADTDLRYILETMTNTGRIYKRDLLKIWEQPQFNQYMQEDAIKEFVLKLLVHLDILIVPKAFKQSSTDVYLVPCMIKATRPDFNNLESQREKTICLQYILSDSSIPSALAYKVIGAAVIAWPLKEEKDKPCLYHKAAVLNVTEDDELRIWVDDNRVNVYLTNKKSLLSISPDAAASIQECLTKNIESSLIFYHSSFGGTLNPTRVSELYYMEIGIPCGSETCFISSLEVTKTNKWTCKNGKEHKTNYVRYWVFDKSQKTCSVGCAGLTDIELQTQPSDKHLVRLGSQIEHGMFREFFLNLGMELQKWHSTESTYTTHSSEGIRSMALKQWKTCNLSKLKDPTLKDLSDALQKVKLDSHLVCQIFREKMDLVEYAELNLQADPTDQHLKELSNQIGNCPLQLGIELGLSFTEVEQSLFRFPKDLPGLVEDILKKWKAKSKVKTILSLMMALQRVDAGGVRYLRDNAKQ